MANIGTILTAATIWVAVVFSGCKENILTIPLAYSDATFVMMSDTCTDSSCNVSDCGGVQILLKRFDTTLPSGRMLNRELTAFYIRKLADSERSQKPLTLLEASRQFLQAAADVRREMPDAPTTWTALGSDSVYRADSIVCVGQSIYMYTGGAHGSNTTRYVTINVNSNKFVTWRDLIRDTNRFRDAAEKAFRKEYGMTSSDTYESRGFWFTDNRFSLPREVGVNNRGYILHYGQYEIAPYSMGEIVVSVPYTE